MIPENTNQSSSKSISLGDEDTVKEVLASLLSTQPPLASAADLEIPRCVDTADEAIALIRQQQAKWLKAKHEAANSSRNSGHPGVIA